MEIIFQELISFLVEFYRTWFKFIYLVWCAWETFSKNWIR